ncbi:hypothetical protein GF326_09355 [Candidatus Bathyarchaeota archaeon]|nr:hypothetical protein [Candidatus Bathyarchaeota archaeon]
MELIEQQPALKQMMVPLLGLVLSTGLLMASLWQIEIAVALPNENFDFPFYICSVNKWWIRDFWYLVNMISWLLGILSTAALVNLHNRKP